MGNCVMVGGNLRESDHLEDPVVDGWIILRWIFQEVGNGGYGPDRCASS